MNPLNMPITAFPYDPESSPWEKMPDEITLIVLKKLSSLEQARFAVTCKKNYRLSLDKELEGLQQHRFFIALSRGETLSSTVAQATRTLSLPPHVSRPSRIFLLARALIPMENLTALTLQGGETFFLGKKGMPLLIASLEKMVCLKRLNLANNRISSEGAEALASVLTKTQGLVTLCIKDNLLGSRGIGYLQGSLRQLPVLRELDISGNSIPAEDVAALLFELPYLRSLDIRSNGCAEEEVGALANSLSRMKDLQELFLGYFEEMEEDALSSLGRALGGLESLKKLYFYMMPEGAFQILAGYLLQIKTLEELRVEESIFNADDAAALASSLCRMPQLKKIDFSSLYDDEPEDENFSQPLFDGIERMHNLTVFNFHNNYLKQERVGRKFAFLRQLRKLDLSFLYLENREIQDLAEGLKGMVLLEELKLEENSITSLGAQALAQATPFLSRLKVFTTSAYLRDASEGIQNWIACLTPLSQLTELIFEVKGVSDAEVFLQEEDAENLGSIVSRMHNLNRLKLKHVTGSSRATQALIREWSSLKHLRSLDLSQTYIGEEGAGTLAHALQSMEHLTHLILEENQLSPLGAQVLAGSLVSLRDVKDLQLGNNSIADAGVEAVITAVSSCMQLTHLGLAKNDITDDGALVLSQSLKKFGYLENVNLKNNQITAQGMQTLAAAFSKQLHLRYIRFDGNPLKKEGLNLLAAAFDQMRDFDPRSAVNLIL